MWGDGWVGGEEYCSVWYVYWWCQYQFRQEGIQVDVVFVDFIVQQFVVMVLGVYYGEQEDFQYYWELGVLQQFGIVGDDEVEVDDEEYYVQWQQLGVCFWLQ